LFEAGIAKRHAFEVFEIDRAVIGSERRRWHPFYPFKMKRHGLTQFPCRRAPDSAILVSQSRDWLTKRSTVLPQLCLVFDDELPQSANSRGNFEYS
jgi:hypothetical protein